MICWVLIIDDFVCVCYSIDVISTKAFLLDILEENAPKPFPRHNGISTVKEALRGRKRRNEKKGAVH